MLKETSQRDLLPQFFFINELLSATCSASVSLKFDFYKKNGREYICVLFVLRVPWTAGYKIVISLLVTIIGYLLLLLVSNDHVLESTSTM
jgi:hypothetical protein